MLFLALIIQSEEPARFTSEWDLKSFGISFYIEHSISDAQRFLTRLRVDLVIINGASFSDGGLSTLRHLEANHVPVVVIASSPSYDFQVAALESGAADVLLWEYPERLLALKMRRLIGTQKLSSQKIDRSLHVGDLVLDPRVSRAVFREHSLNLTVKQFQLLYILAHHNGDYVHRQTLAEGLAVSPDSRSVDMMINRLRSALRKVASNELSLETAYGLGYRLHARNFDVELKD